MLIPIAGVELKRGSTGCFSRQTCFQSHHLKGLGESFLLMGRGAFDSAKNHKRQRRKRQSVPAKREKSQTPKFG